jgi:hypothetical protein
MTGSGFRVRTLIEENTGVSREKARDEGGFAIVVVLVALLMLSVLGAMSLLVMVSSLQGVVNLKPEDKAFQVAEAALHVAHSKIVNDEVEAGPVSGKILGGDYTIEIEPIGVSTIDYLVTSEGSYEKAGTVYRRKIQEEVSYSGMQAFDVMRKYLLFAKNDINITLDDGINLDVPVTILGDIRAEHDVNIRCVPTVTLGDGFTINGSVEAKNRLYVLNEPDWGGSLNVRLLGDIKTGDRKTGSLGTVTLDLERGILFHRRIYAATDNASTVNDIYARLPIQEIIRNKWGVGTLGNIYKGNLKNEPGCDPVYIPKPNFEYYKALAKEQGNYFVGNLDLNNRRISQFVSPGSSVVVIYATGNINLGSFIWDQANIKGTLVCEGDFTSSQTLTIWNSLQFQVITKGNATFRNSWDIFPQVVRENNAFFVWANGNVTLNMGMWSGNSLQVTSMGNINVVSEKLFSTCRVRYQPPDVDVGGFPIDITIKNWRELPSEGD